MSTSGQLWIEVVGELIIARVRGEPTEELLREARVSGAACVRRG
jgi:hypothetical protein